jgi:hypothetical protein
MRNVLNWSVPALVLVGVLALPALAQEPRRAGPLYQYQILTEFGGGTTGAQKLNQSGAVGWELVSVVCSGVDSHDNCYYYFKRER